MTIHTKIVLYTKKTLDTSKSFSLHINNTNKLELYSQQKYCTQLNISLLTYIKLFSHSSLALRPDNLPCMRVNSTVRTKRALYSQEQYYVHKNCTVPLKKSKSSLSFHNEHSGSICNIFFRFYFTDKFLKYLLNYYVHP